MNINDKNRPIFDLNNFQELINLIPKLQEAVTLGMERELEKPKQKKKIIKMDRSFLREVSTIVQGKWTIDILFMIYFLKNPYFNEIRKSLPEINTRTLTSRLLSLDEKGIIKRIVHAGRPVRVSYKITPLGEGLTNFFVPMAIYVILAQNQSSNHIKIN